MKSKLWVVAVTLGVLITGLYLSDSPPHVSAAPSVGANSCTGAGACQNNESTNAVIGDNSCQGDGSCSNLGTNANIGNGSCNGTSACSEVSGEVDNNSCNDTSACFDVDQLSSIGNFSCSAPSACQILIEVEVGANSCNATSACQLAESVTVGISSCNDTSACQTVEDAIIGNFSCNGVSACQSLVDETIGDCELNEDIVGRSLEACYVQVSKSAAPDRIPETGDTPVTYTVLIEAIEDLSINSIDDDKYPGLSFANDCDLFDSSDVLQAPVTLPFVLNADWYVECVYTYEPPAGDGGETHDNTVTVNVGEGLQLGTAAVTPGETPGTYDLTASASVLYLEVDPGPDPTPVPDDRGDHIRPRPPALGAGLSGLFNGMPTPLPTAPSAAAPVTTIRPPNTGDAGLADHGTGAYAFPIAVLSLVLAGGTLLRLRTLLVR